MSEQPARLKTLRLCFERAKKRLEALPDTGLSEAGQPYIEEVAGALQSFAAWFGQLTFDDYSMFGSARRVHVALAAFDAIVDWVGLHRSQQFASDIAGQMAELVEQSQALDDAVMAAFLVERTPNSVTYRTSAFVPEEKREAVEDGIEAVASLAGHLGIRLQRVALMAGSNPPANSGNGKRTKVQKRPGPGGRKDLWPKPLKRRILADRSAYERKMAKRKRPPLKAEAWVRTDWATAQSPGMEPDAALRLWRAAKRAKYR